LSETNKSKWNEKHPDLFVRLSSIVKGMSIEEEIRLLKIIVELLKVDGISLDFLETLFLAMQEANVNAGASEDLLDLTDDFVTINCDVKYERTTIKEFIQKVERVLSRIEKNKNPKTLD